MKLYQINADDLEYLESAMPVICFRCGELLNDTDVRMKFRRIKEIVSNIRWDYGPPSEVQIVPLDPKEH